MKAICLSTFTPSMMSHDALESVFVQRESLLDRIVTRISGSARGKTKHHTLLIGPRGIGKTHVVSLVYHRIRAASDLKDRLLIAWLREEEYGITALRDFVMRILTVLADEYADSDLREHVQALYGLDGETAERQSCRLLKEYVDDRTLLVITENLDQTFEGLGDIGQQRLRAYIQRNPFFTILATAQSLFGGVQLQTSPFYGFFSLQHLQGLTFEEAVELLVKIAAWCEDPELASFVRTALGRGRIRAVHHLGGGNHRVYVIFSQFLTRDSLDALVEAVMQMLEKLTPYYQARMAQLSPQQRKIAEYLCERRGAAPVKEIAERCFTTSQTISSQLQTLRDMGYVRSTQVGRESYYELREPLMRICIEVKKQRGEPVRLLVEFLRIWYSREELESGLRALGPSAQVDREYFMAALRASCEAAEDPRLEACRADYDGYFAGGDYERALQAAEDAMAVREDAEIWLDHGLALGRLGRHDQALASFEKATELDPENAAARENHGVAMLNLGRNEEALASFEKAVALEAKRLKAWVSRGVALQRLGRDEEALASFEKALELDPKGLLAWASHGVALQSLGRHEEALASFEKALELDPKSISAWGSRGAVLGSLGRDEEALASFEKALELDPEEPLAWASHGTALLRLHRNEEALASLEKAVALDPESVSAWGSCGEALESLGRHEEALASFEKALELDPEKPVAWARHGTVLLGLHRNDEALASLEKAVALGAESVSAWGNRGAALESLGRHEEALASFEKALELDPEEPLAWTSHGTALLRLHRNDEALASLEKAVALDPESTVAWGNRGVALAGLRRYDEALAAFDKALELDPQDAAAWTNRGVALAKLRRYDEALDSLSKAVAADKRAPVPVFARACVLVAAGRWEEGLQTLDKALETFPRAQEGARDCAEEIMTTLRSDVPEPMALGERLSAFAAVYAKHQATRFLAAAFLEATKRVFQSPSASSQEIRAWLDAWQQTVADSDEFQLPFRLFDAALRYRTSKKPDERVLLELPEEERRVVISLLGLDKEEKEEE